MGVSWHDIAFMPDPELADEAQAAWSWLVPSPWRVLVCATVGGIFLETESGKVRWLDVGTGFVEDVAESVEGFEAILRSGEPVIDEWFLPGFVEALHEAGKRPGPGEAFFPIILPVFRRRQIYGRQHGRRTGPGTAPRDSRYSPADR
jgi:hypothetical protein